MDMVQYATIRDMNGLLRKGELQKGRTSLIRLTDTTTSWLNTVMKHPLTTGFCIPVSSFSHLCQGRSQSELHNSGNTEQFIPAQHSTVQRSIAEHSKKVHTQLMMQADRLERCACLLAQNCTSSIQCSCSRLVLRAAVWLQNPYACNWHTYSHWSGRLGLTY